MRPSPPVLKRLMRRRRGRRPAAVVDHIKADELGFGQASFTKRSVTLDVSEYFVVMVDEPAVFPDQIACPENLAGQRLGRLDAETSRNRLLPSSVSSALAEGLALERNPLPETGHQRLRSSAYESMTPRRIPRPRGAWCLSGTREPANSEEMRHD